MPVKICIQKSLFFWISGRASHRQRARMIYEVCNGLRENTTLDSSQMFSQPFSSPPKRFEHAIHLAPHAALRQLLFEHLTNARVFIFVFDLIAAGFHAFGSAPLLSQSAKLAAAERF